MTTIGQLEQRLWGVIKDLTDAEKDTQKQLGGAFLDLKQVLDDLNHFEEAEIVEHLFGDLSALCQLLFDMRRRRDPRLAEAEAKESKLADAIRSLCKERLPKLKLALKPPQGDPEPRGTKPKL